METILRMIPATLMVAGPLMIAGLGGIVSERAGIVNIAIEGIMLVGAFAAASTVVYMERAGMYDLAPWIAIIVALIAGLIYSILLAVSTITFNADHTIAGTAINMLSTGLTVYLCQILFNQQRTEAFAKGFTKVSVPILKDIPVLGSFFSGVYPTIFIAVALIFIFYFILFKTPFGLQLRSCGENPHASASMGINVYRMRYVAVLISGALAGLAGGIFVLTADTQFTAVSIHGMGFIAVASVIFGKWNPFGLMGTSLFFGFSQTLGLYANDIPILNQLPTELFSAIPYVLTIVALIIFSGKSVGPKAAGEIYDAGKR